MTRKLLIAEDDRTSRMMLTAILEKEGYDVIAAADGREALKIMRQPDPPHILLLDWEMPEFDGVEVTRLIRNCPSPFPPYIIFITAREIKEDIVEGLETGGNDYIIKPYELSELLARIHVAERVVSLEEELLATQEKLHYQALYDPLTEIFNRRAILDILSRELSHAERKNLPLSVAIFDIDHFKVVNDTYGHQTGDDVLHSLIELLRSKLREYDYIGRYGGEEFLLVTVGNEEENPTSLYTRLRQLVADTPIPTRQGDVAVTISIGATRREDISTADSLIAKADEALYQAKTSGRNRVVFLDTSREIE